MKRQCGGQAMRMQPFGKCAVVTDTQFVFFHPSLAFYSSELLPLLAQYEVVAISSDALHSLHPQSIALNGQPSNNPDGQTRCENAQVFCL